MDTWPKRKEYTTPEEKRKDFWIGFGLFWGVNILLLIVTIAAQAGLYSLESSSSPNAAVTGIVGLTLTLLPWVINGGLLIFLAVTRTQMAFGMLAGLGSAFALVVLAFIVLLIICFTSSGSGFVGFP